MAEAIKASREAFAEGIRAARTYRVAEPERRALSNQEREPIHLDAPPEEDWR